MKSLVMGAAVRYPPNLLNFFFLDFKGGAAFSVFEDLPHVSGVVTNLKPELVERGLDSIRNEIERRQERFSREHVQNIWEYNRNQADRPLPHLVLLLDEFARGLADFSAPARDAGCARPPGTVTGHVSHPGQPGCQLRSG